GDELGRRVQRARAGRSRGCDRRRRARGAAAPCGARLVVALPPPRAREIFDAALHLLDARERRAGRRPLVLASAARLVTRRTAGRLLELFREVGEVVGTRGLLLAVALRHRGLLLGGRA